MYSRNPRLITLFTAQNLLLLGLLSMSAELSGCAKTLSGTYADERAGTSLTFESNGKVVLHSFRTDYPTVYKYSGDTIKVQVTLTDVVFTVNKDGSISGPAEMHFTKK